MSELTKVPGPPSPLRGIGGKVVAVVAVAVALAIVKPWGSNEPVIAGLPDLPEPSASSSPAASTSSIEDLGYDNAVFGVYEPKPEWALWPAGYFTTFGFAMRIDERSPPPPVATPDPEAGSSADPAGPSDGPDAGSTTTESAVPSVSAAPTADIATPSPSPTDVEGAMVPPPQWTDVIPFNAQSHLTLMAINMPIGFRIPEARLTRVASDGSTTVEPLVRLDSPWPIHFLVLGIDDGTGRGAVTAWPVGRYRLDLTVEPGGYRRTIHVEVGGPDDAVAPSVAPFIAPTPSLEPDPGETSAN